MRKQIVFVLSVLLAMLLCAGASGEGFSLLLVQTPDGDALTENAVSVSVNGESIWIAPAAWVKQDSVLTIYQTDGSALSVSKAEKLGDSQLVMLTAEIPEKTSPYTLALEADRENLICSGFTAAGRSSVRASRVSPTVWHGLEAYTLTSAENLLPGAVLLSAQGQLAGILIGEWGERKGNYLALSAQAVHAALRAEDREEIALRGPAPNQEDSTITPGMLPDLNQTPLQDYLNALEEKTYFDLSVEDGLVRVSYRDSLFEKMKETGEAYVCFLYDGNDYFVWNPIKSQTDYSFPAIPEHDVYVWISDSSANADADEHIISDIGHAAIPAAGPSTRFNYQQECYPAVGEADIPDEIEMARSDWNLDDYLAGKRLYLQVIGSYDVEEFVQEFLTFILYAPDGQVYFYNVAYFNYEPEIAAHDAWHADLTELFESCLTDSGSAPSGTYTIAYYIKGELAGSTEFEITP